MILPRRVYLQRWPGTDFLNGESLVWPPGADPHQSQPGLRKNSDQFCRAKQHIAN